MSETVLTPPAALPITADEVELRSLLRLMESETDENSLITSLIASAVNEAEGYLRRRFITQTLRVVRSGFGGGAICAPVAPVQSVAAVEYLGVDGVWQTIDPATYRLAEAGALPVVVPVYGQVWPVPVPQPGNVRIDWVVGYGDAATDIPAKILHALRVQVVNDFDNRSGEGDTQGLCKRVRGMLKPYVVYP